MAAFGSFCHVPTLNNPALPPQAEERSVPAPSPKHG